MERTNRLETTFNLFFCDAHTLHSRRERERERAREEENRTIESAHMASDTFLTLCHSKHWSLVVRCVSSPKNSTPGDSGEETRREQMNRTAVGHVKCGPVWCVEWSKVKSKW